MDLHTLLIIIGFVVGLCIGSFLNVVGLRLLKEESFVTTPSHCPECNAGLAWYDNIPVVSFLLLGAKCRACKTGISIQYPIIELLSGVLFAGIVMQFGEGLGQGVSSTLYAAGTCVFLMFLVANLLVIIITDWRESLIYTINSLSLVPAGLAYNLLMLGSNQETSPLNLGFFIWQVPQGLIEGLLGILAAIVIFEGLILLSRLAFGTEGFGHGDTHLMMGVGAFLGWKLCVLAIFMGFIVQTIPSIPILVIQWIKNKQWISLISGGVGMVFGLLPLLLSNTPAISGNSQLFTMLLLGCMVFSISALIVFMKTIKQSQSFTYLPLGPALVIASIACLFWGDLLLRRF